MESEGSVAAAPAERKKEGWGAMLRFLLLLFVLALGLRTFVAAPFSIPSGSMMPALMPGDYLFIAKWPYGFSRFSFPFGLAGFEGRLMGSLPERGDVVVFRYPGEEQDDYVKRVIGLPGDVVEMRSGLLWLNGEPVPRHRIADFLAPVSPNSPCRGVADGGAREIEDEEGNVHCAYARYRETLPGGRAYEVIDQTRIAPGDDMAEMIVPEGHLFVMGDNRDDSFDSRFPLETGGVGLVPADHLIGRALISFFSTDGSAEWTKPWTWASAARWERIGMRLR